MKKSQHTLIEELHQGSVVTTGEGKSYYFMPYWYEETPNSTRFIRHRLGHLPKELRDELNNKRTGFKDTDMKTNQRFKTKQELELSGVRDKLSFLVPHGEPFNPKAMYLHYTEEWITTTPHPHSGKSFKIRVTPQESEMVQKKVFALGLWGDRKKLVPVGDPHLYLHAHNTMTTSTESDNLFFANFSYPELTPQQFMEGEVPLDNITEFKDYCKADQNIYEEELGSGGARRLKADAYVGKNNGLWVWIGGSPTCVPIREAYRYNLMSEEDFKAKHPDTLMFKNWEVTVEGKNIRVACHGHAGKVFRKVDIERWMKTGHKIFVNASIEDAFEFLDANKEKLSLSF